MTQTELSSLSPFSLDVVSMYTNVQTEEAVKATTNMLIENKIDLRGLHINDFKVLLNFMLKNNFFEFQGHYFLQHRGLAMGSRIAPILAIVALDKLERSTIYSTISCPIPFYQRYVDDSLILLKSNKEAEALLLRMNNSHPTLKFELEHPTKDNSI